MDAAENHDQYVKWEELIEEQEKSGLSQIEFCKQRNLKASQFGYYRGVIKSKDKIKTNQKNQQLFSAVQIKKPDLTASEIKIILPNGFQCVIPSAMDTAQLKKIMGALLSC
jgi:hypothetical protein